jgi:ankyrin repeat protein
MEVYGGEIIQFSIFQKEFKHFLKFSRRIKPILKLSRIRHHSFDHIASCYDHLETGKPLVQNGSNINARVDDGNTALSFTEEYGNDEIAFYLREKGAE